MDKLDLCLLYGFNDLSRVLKFKGFVAIMDTGPVLFSFLARFCLGFFFSFYGLCLDAGRTVDEKTNEQWKFVYLSITLKLLKTWLDLLNLMEGFVIFGLLERKMVLVTLLFVFVDCYVI